MVLTNDATLHDRLVRYKGQGLAKYREYWHDIAGFNYRMTNIQAAIGMALLEQIQSFIDKKQPVASWYQKYLKELPVTFHRQTKDVFHTYWMFSILVEKADMLYLLHSKNVT